MQNPVIAVCDEGCDATVEPEELHPSDNELTDSPPTLGDELRKESGSVNERDLYSSGVPKSPPRSTELVDS
jgi:hypothetical protein